MAVERDQTPLLSISKMEQWKVLYRIQKLLFKLKQY